ncbi:MAG: UDP-MurNAc hydroxylase [Planctomycetota bacterium]
MRTTLIGHATFLIETGAGNLLTDPVFFDPFEEGTVVSCPRREVDLDALPALDAVFISHRHLDHLDLPSLAALDRALPVFCPADPFVLSALQQLGFADVRPLASFEAVRLGDLELLPLPSANPDVLEHALLISDGEASVLQQVDALLAPETLKRLAAERPVPDLHLAMYASQHFGFFENRRQDLAASHAANLGCALALGAGCVVPASAGFRFAEPHDWLNPHVFPVSRERFASDLARLAPSARCEQLDPGDVLVIDKQAAKQLVIERSSSPFVRTLEQDGWRIGHDPTAPVPELIDADRAGYGRAAIVELVSGLFGQGLREYVERALVSGDDLVTRYRELAVAYRVDVVLPGDPLNFTIDFGSTPVAHDAATEPTVRLRIAGSTLVELVLGRTSWFRARPSLRRSISAVEYLRTERGLEARGVDLDDLLLHYIGHGLPNSHRHGLDWLRLSIRGLPGVALPTN